MPTPTNEPQIVALEATRMFLRRMRNLYQLQALDSSNIQEMHALVSAYMLPRVAEASADPKHGSPQAWLVAWSMVHDIHEGEREKHLARQVGSSLVTKNRTVPKGRTGLEQAFFQYLIDGMIQQTNTACEQAMNLASDHVVVTGSHDDPGLSAAPKAARQKP